MTGQRDEDRNPSSQRADGNSSVLLEESLRSAVSERVDSTRFALWFGNNVRLGLNQQGDLLTATFNIAPDAPMGTPTIQASTSLGVFNTRLFSITQPPIMSKEYIYLGDRLIAVEAQ